ncbi:ABC-type multidrug transport system fused ATPase/permease subunit [Hymenobacter luteus]|uniref:ABC-type multidrug transport system fused ATPase/permease subunit n=2 Tax=Hymenobacter TaxID=89966 RepID=A0A7W9T1T9_9BACT|nr:MULTISPECIES: ABC transporter ATP-binding protein [Hymenobacter]MBB4600675.1 ABC-type multidrug transport system fused ATPase/permease subunit [Hymenobacter latericoloratus]MBB6059118.1 ABC-type multidrug transport system fused ATPase/permease subunit [Hymenobacter luteus]
MSLWEIIKRLFPYVRPYRGLVLATLLLTLVGSLAAQVNPFVLRYTVDTVQGLLNRNATLAAGMPLLLLVSGLLLGKEIINTFIQFGQKFYGEKIRINVSSRLMHDAVQRVVGYQLGFYADTGNQTGKLQTRIDRGVESLMKLVQNFFIDILPLFANSIVALVVMFTANVYVGLVAVAVLPVYFWLSYRQADRLNGTRRALRGLREARSQGLVNLIDSAVVIKSFVREDYEAQKQNQQQDALQRAQLETRKTNFLYDGLKTFTEQIGVVLIIILTAYLVLDRQISIGAIMFHILLFNNVSAPIRQLHRIYDEMNDALTYSEGFFDILDAENATEPTGTLQPAHLRGTFDICNVDFTYPSGTQALHDVCLTIEAGKTTALVGLSGAGKSTIINLLCKFYAPDHGKMLLDGQPLSDYDTHALRQHIGLVLQKNHIFKGTIEENIRYGLMDATPEQIQQAAKQAYLHEQIMGLPKGYQSDAQQLSGGQQQRIAIARLFLKNPPIIFLDEPTASLDAIATEQIKNSLDAIKQGRTVVIISHSLAQIVDADCIYVMKQGRMVESGTHEQLYDRRGTYREIFDASARSLNIEKLARVLVDDGDEVEDTAA